MDYQWFRNGVALPGATGPTLVIANVQPANLGTYTVQVSTQHRTLESQDASLQINLTGLEVQPVLAMDKQLDEANAPVQLRLGNAPPVGGLLAPAALVRGYTGTQIFDTTGATTSGGEHPVCGVLGGASEWISFVAAQDGTLVLNTDGSSYDTVMAVFKRFPGSSAWVEVACDNTNGLDRLDSALSVPVEAGKTNLIVVDGVRSAKGTLKLNYSLVTPAQLASLGFTVQREHRLRYTGRPTSKFSIQVSGNFATWTTLTLMQNLEPR